MGYCTLCGILGFGSGSAAGADSGAGSNTAGASATGAAGSCSACSAAGGGAGASMLSAAGTVSAGSASALHLHKASIVTWVNALLAAIVIGLGVRGRMTAGHSFGVPLVCSCTACSSVSSSPTPLVVELPLRLCQHMHLLAPPPSLASLARRPLVALPALPRWRSQQGAIQDTFAQCAALLCLSPCRSACLLHTGSRPRERHSRGTERAVTAQLLGPNRSANEGQQEGMPACGIPSSCCSHTASGQHRSRLCLRS